MSEKEMQFFEQRNQGEIKKLQQTKFELMKKQNELEKVSGSYNVLNFIKHYGKQITISTGVITIIGSCATLQNLSDSILVVSTSVAVVLGLQFGSKLLLTHSNKLEQVSNIKQEITRCTEEADVRYQVEIFISCGVVLATIGYYQNCLKTEWVKNDFELKFFIEKMIQQLLEDKELECKNPEEYERVLFERDKKLEAVLEKQPEKVCLLNKINKIKVSQTLDKTYC